jgi:hypothetical protein
MESAKMTSVPSALPSADAWHSPTKAIQSALSVALVAGGSWPAPMEPGSKRATIAGSEDAPGPHVPPMAGLGRATNDPEMANAAPKSPNSTNASLGHIRREACSTCDPLSTERDDRTRAARSSVTPPTPMIAGGRAVAHTP